MQMGGEIGIINTLLLCVLTAIIGGFLVRKQGLETFIKGQKALSQGSFPIDELFHGLCIAIAGALLMTPGFFTDIIGFSLLVPAFRQILKVYISEHLQDRVAMKGQSPHTHNDRHDDVVEGEFTRIDDTK